MPSGLQLFILMGQSNLSGNGDPDQIPAGVPATPSKIWNYRFDGTWQNPAQDPLHITTDSVYSVFVNAFDFMVGPGIFFADRFSRYHPSLSIGLIPCGKSGVAISAYDRPVGGTDTTTMYGAARARWEAAQASGTIAGVIYYQGETDANSGLSSGWAAKFQTLVSNIRTDIGDPNLPVVFVQIGPCTAGWLDDHPEWPVFQTMQSRVPTLGRCMMVANKDTTLNPPPNDIHLATAGQLVVGHRVADAMRILGA